MIADLTAYQVAQKIGKMLRKKYGKDEAKNLVVHIDESTHPAVMWEEGPYEWAVDVSGGEKIDALVLAHENGFYLECVNSFTLIVVPL